MTQNIQTNGAQWFIAGPTINAVYVISPIHSLTGINIDEITFLEAARQGAHLMSCQIYREGCLRHIYNNFLKYYFSGCYFYW